MYGIEQEIDRSCTCGHCNAHLRDGDKYCRKCGTRRGEGAFVPSMTMMQCIYGPAPVRRVRKCTRCGKTRETFLMIDNENYCPDCGGLTKIIEEDC